jgi:hypothetical protein
MAFASFATALRAWVQHFGWTGAPAVLFGLAASEIRPDEARLDDAALELRRALINNRRGADTDAAAGTEGDDGRAPRCVAEPKEASTSAQRF